MKHQPYNKLKGALREKGVTYKKLADALEISVSSVSSKINGISDFYIDEVLKIEKYFCIDTDVFLKE